MEPTKPYWLNDAPYQDFRSTAELPARADVVVIGGGITGVSTAYFLRKHGVEVTLLERRGLSGGATGRNGGHISPGTSERFSESVRRYGVERTRAIYDYSTRCALAVQDFVRENDVQEETAGFAKTTPAQRNSCRCGNHSRRCRSTASHRNIGMRRRAPSGRAAKTSWEACSGRRRVNCGRPSWCLPWPSRRSGAARTSRRARRCARSSGTTDS